MHVQTCSGKFDRGTRTKGKHSCVQRNIGAVLCHRFRGWNIFWKVTKTQSNPIWRAIQCKIKKSHNMLKTIFRSSMSTKCRIFQKQIYARINNKLVGLLLRARKYQVLDFTGSRKFVALPTSPMIIILFFPIRWNVIPAPRWWCANFYVEINWRN